MATPYRTKNQGDKLLADEWNEIQTRARDDLAAVEKRLVDAGERLDAVQAELDAGLVPPRVSGFYQVEGPAQSAYVYLPSGLAQFSVCFVDDPKLTLRLDSVSVVQLGATIDIKPGAQPFVQFVLAQTVDGVEMSTPIVVGQHWSWNGTANGWIQLGDGRSDLAALPYDGWTAENWTKKLKLYDTFYKKYNQWPICGTSVLRGEVPMQIMELIELPAGEYQVQLAFFTEMSTGTPTGYRNVSLNALVLRV